MIQYAYKDGGYMKILCLKTKLIQKDFAKRLQTLLPQFEIVEPKCKNDILEKYFFDEDIALVIGYNVGNGCTLKMPLVKKLLICPTALEFERDILLPDKAEHNLANETFALFGRYGTLPHFQTKFLGAYSPTVPFFPVVRFEENLPSPSPHIPPRNRIDTTTRR